MKFKAVFLIIIIVAAIIWMATTKEESSLPKINGVSLVAPRDSMTIDALESVKRINAGWVAIIPYSFVNKSNPEVIFDNGHQWWGERSEGAKTTINYAKAHGLKVMLKPHTWVRGEGWAGDFELDTEEEWKIWEDSYRKYILKYAQIAQNSGVEMLCIGTEYRKAATQRSLFWVDLIHKIRNIYSGKLIYAANWDNYNSITFWNKLDYIGIDAYYPLSNEKTPTMDSLTISWNVIKRDIANLSNKYNKKVIFTEFGYESIDYSAKGHWLRNDTEASPNQLAQANGYKAIFDLWKEDWFEGGFLWKWHTNHEQIGGPNCKRYTPQNKQAEEVITEFYCKN